MRAVTLCTSRLSTFVKAARENGLDMRIGVFCGDGRHDSYAHYHYSKKRGVIPVIPLLENRKKAFPHFLEDRGVRLDTDGAPL